MFSLWGLRNSWAPLITHGFAFVQKASLQQLCEPVRNGLSCSDRHQWSVKLLFLAPFLLLTYTVFWCSSKVALASRIYKGSWPRTAAITILSVCALACHPSGPMTAPGADFAPLIVIRHSRPLHTSLLIRERSLEQRTIPCTWAPVRQRLRPSADILPLDWTDLRYVNPFAT